MPENTEFRTIETEFIQFDVQGDIDRWMINGLTFRKPSCAANMIPA